MKRRIFQRSRKVGMSPGSLVYIGEERTAEVSVDLIEFDGDGYFLEKSGASMQEVAEARHTAAVSWINVTGLQRVDLIEEIGSIYDVHPLLLEDILNTDQRPKADIMGGYQYLILKKLRWMAEPAEIEMEQISLVLGPTFVITFQEQPADIFDPLRQRIRDGHGRIRNLGADYLAYSILDTIVDYYFYILENIGDQVETLESVVMVDPEPEVLKSIQELKRQLMMMRKSIWPLREVIGAIQRGESPLFREGTLIFLRDVYEHTIQVIDSTETFRDMVSGMLDIYLSSVSNRMNEVMKVLTIIATIFIPLTFITSLYGMNFQYMPELSQRWGYPMVWAANIIIGAGLLIYFRRRKWL